LEEDAARVSGMAKDISEVLVEVGLQGPVNAAPIRVAYHAACSLQHGQQIKTDPKDLLRSAGFEIMEPAEPHLCCGSAGTYNLLQPEISKQLKERKVSNLAATQPDIISTGNIGCMMQIGSSIGVPVVHTAELLDWATGGPIPAALTAEGQKRARHEVFFRMPAESSAKIVAE